MNTAGTVLAMLLAVRASIREDCGRLLLEAPPGAIDGRLLDQVREHKVEIISALRKEGTPARQAAAWLATVDDPGLRADLREIFEERAGICEFHGGLARLEAERIALDELRGIMKKGGFSS